MTEQDRRHGTRCSTCVRQTPSLTWCEAPTARRLDTDALCAQFDVNQRRLQAARRLWTMFWLRLLQPGVPSAQRNPPGTVHAQAQRLLQLLDTA